VVDASPVHFFCGMWGTIAAGLFAKPDNVKMAYGTGSCGAFYKVIGGFSNKIDIFQYDKMIVYKNNHHTSE
jgi:ammonia channel protein AmtB